LCAVHLFARAVARGLHVERAQLRVGLTVRIGVHTGARTDSTWPAAARRCRERFEHVATRRLSRRWRGSGAAGGIGRRGFVLVFQTLDTRASDAFQLRFDPVDCGTVAICALPAIAELREALDCR